MEHPEVQRIAGELEATPAQIALAWLLHHAEHVLLIPGTSPLATSRRTSAQATSRSAMSTWPSSTASPRSITATPVRPSATTE